MKIIAFINYHQISLRYLLEIYFKTAAPNANSIDCNPCNIRQSNFRRYASYLTHLKRYMCNEFSGAKFN